MLRIIWLLIACFSLNSCGLFPSDPVQDHNAICKEIKNRMMFGGATGDATVASQQRAEMDNLSRSYREEKCD